MDFSKLEKKWQERWEKAKLFEADPGSREKFFCTFPYPYINAYQHIGHFFTLMRVEALARYKRLQGFNVLFPQGWHVTGSPIVNAAKRVKDREEKQMKIMRDMGFSDDEIVKFERTEYWVEFFEPEFIKDYKSVGMSVDWRRTFHTTSLNPHYDRFIKWQFRKLKEKGYVIKGKFPVVWDPKEGCPVGDHDRVEGEGETPQEFLLVKHKLEDGRYIVSATLRPDTILGITNLYMHPDKEYAEAAVGDERWILSRDCAERLKEQDHEVEIKGMQKGTDFIGKYTEEIDGHKVPILPATFLDMKFGTGLVHSVPSDSADDLIALHDLQKDEETLEKYGLDAEEIKNIVPIPVLDTPGMGDIPAAKMLEKYSIKHQNERQKLDKIKEELYKLSYYTATYNSRYKDFFSKDLSGKKVEEGKNLIKDEIIDRGWGALYYELTGKVVSRTLTECIVKIVDDQWFLDYNNPEWKKLAHECLDNMKLYPEISRTQFDYVIDWLHEWACTREEGLGTKLPWDEKWIIESLSDSTIYMAYYTICHLLHKVDAEKIDDNFFDYVLLGQGDKPEIENVDEMKKNFEYFYPMDFRNSGKDLIQNHLTFSIFNHTAIFPKKHWPQSFGVNGWVTVDGQKMSKSLGNMILVRDMVKKFSADASRITILNGGEKMDDPNWDSEFARSMKNKLAYLALICEDNYGKHDRTDRNSIDMWLESELNRTVKEATEAMELTNFRSAIQQIYFGMQKALRHYIKRTKGECNKELIDEFIEKHIIMLAPFTPHVCEEIWEKTVKAKKGMVIEQRWPSFEESKIDKRLSMAESYIAQVIEDINNVKQLAKLDKLNKIKLFSSSAWKYGFYDIVRKEIESGNRDFKDVLEKVMATELKKHGKDVTKMLPMLLKKGVPEAPSKEDEERVLSENRDIIAEEFGAEAIIESAEVSNEGKAKQASPGKPAILVE